MLKAIKYRAKFLNNEILAARISYSENHVSYTK